MIALAIVLLLAWVYVFPMAKWELAVSKWMRPKSDPIVFQTYTQPEKMIRLVQFLAICWFVFFGACIGSFFNVVAWRWPNGRGIVFGGSKCPYCDNQLKFHHNIPIVGWLWCKGRCAFCRLPVSSRYLWMELVFGAIFASLALREIVTGGANLPNWNIYTQTGFEETVFTPKWPLITAYLQHAFAFASMVMVVASSVDKLKFPWAGWSIFVALIAAPKLFLPEIEFVRWSDGLPADWLERIRPATEFLFTHSNVATVLIGGVIGLLVGYLTSLIALTSDSQSDRRHWAMFGLLLGAVFGWQAGSVALLVGAIGATFVGRAIRIAGFNPSPSVLAILVAVVFAQHMFWREIVIMMIG